MQLPIVAPAEIVSKHAQVFRSLFNDVRQYQNFQNYLTGLIVLENKSLANISRCIINSADKSNLSRFMSESPWQPTEVNRVRIDYMLEQTAGIRMAASESYFIIDDTLCEHVGSLFEYVDRHYNHCDGSYPLAHNLVTSHYLSGAVRMPIHAEIYRRYETVTEWERFMLKHFPEQEIPKTAEERTKVHKKCDAKLLEDPDFLELHQRFRTKIEIAQTLLAKALAQGVAFTTILTGTYAVLITNRCDWSAAQMVAKYLHRWPIETFYWDSKQLLGLDEYRTRSFAAIEAHWCLVFVAYSLLHLDCLPLSSIQDSSPRPTIPYQSIGAVCRQQAQSLTRAPNFICS